MYKSIRVAYFGPFVILMALDLVRYKKKVGSLPLLSFYIFLHFLAISPVLYWSFKIFKVYFKNKNKSFFNRQGSDTQKDDPTCANSQPKKCIT